MKSLKVKESYKKRFNQNVKFRIHTRKQDLEYINDSYQKISSKNNTSSKIKKGLAEEKGQNMFIKRSLV